MSEKQIDPKQIAYISYQIRQLEIYRNDEKKDHKKQAFTLQIRQLKAQLDPLLMAYAEQEKKSQSTLVVDKDLADKDIGPEEVVAAMHTYCQMKITQEAVVNHLATGQPLSIAGDYNGFMYIIHIEKAKPDGK